MTVSFLHTADWQLGKPFAGIGDQQKRALVQQERVAALHRVAGIAQAQGAEFIVVAGDLFDSTRATKPTVSAACAAIGAMGVPVYVIPGNHDHGGPGCLWEQPFFRHEQEHLAPNLRLLLKPEPVELPNAVLLPCPLLRKHETRDATAWLRTLDLEPFGDKPRLVLAHGSIQGFGAIDDEEEFSASVNRIDLSQLPEDRFDYIALGDWHGMKQVGPKAWYAGTPEPDRFSRGAGNDPGHVLLITASRGGMPEVKPVHTARLGWHRTVFEFSDDNGPASLEAEVDALIAGRARQDLLRLELRGTLGIEAMTSLEQKLEAWQSRLLRLKLYNRTIVAPSEAETEALVQRTSDPLIARVAAKLVARASGQDEDAALARLALRELHAACAH